jgi:hypothetical protein
MLFVFVCIEWCTTHFFFFFFFFRLVYPVLPDSLDCPFLFVDPGFQVRRAHLTKLRRAKGGAKMFGVFRVKNHDFTPTNHIFFQF